MQNKINVKKNSKYISVGLIFYVTAKKQIKNYNNINTLNS